eukprot:CAMPEP_0176193840 /NCGR_PEP_ID=MMETSP0121_2-20121125/5694_1 /TAXON_ID=160619 /ORGANISM="Kryptoperidinium foliaceum, Strain CCMP 1326" /LENGTH=133 /DNA_ID=CAMNT_0017532571 /DNA_START=110 /DNA_END=508 /DNA_ORIENTATION=+
MLAKRSTLMPTSSTSFEIARSFCHRSSPWSASWAKDLPCSNFSTSTPKEYTSNEYAGNPKFGAREARTSGGAQSKRTFVPDRPAKRNGRQGSDFVRAAGQLFHEAQIDDLHSATNSTALKENVAPAEVAVQHP